MQEVYYVYKTKTQKGFKLIPDRGRRLTEIEVDVSIAHQENVPLGSIKWHKVIVNPTAATQKPANTNKVGTKKANKMPETNVVRKSWPEKMGVISDNIVRWDSLLSVGATA